MEAKLAILGDSSSGNGALSAAQVGRGGDWIACKPGGHQDLGSWGLHLHSPGCGVCSGAPTPYTRGDKMARLLSLWAPTLAAPGCGRAQRLHFKWVIIPC